MNGVKAVRVRVPAWLEMQSLIKPLLDEARMKMEYYRSQMKYLEEKHKTSFARFHKKVNGSRNEDVGEWDDYIEWEAMMAAFNEWKQKHKDLAACLK